MPDLSRWLDRVTCGDCLEVLREVPDCSVELCATDPPYGIAFMGRGWDQDIPARAIWAEVLRVLKPGASCFVCAGSRQDTILGMLTDLREVGFDIQHAALSWVYWNGFPKSTDVGKDFDKAAFLAWLREVPPGETETRQALMGWDAADVRKAASAAVNGAYSTDPQNHANTPDNMISACGANGRPWMVEYGKGTGTLLLTALQARFGDAPGVRQKVGEYVAPDGNGRDSDASIRGGNWGNTAGQREAALSTITSPATPEAVEWDGWHSGSVPLKPSAEQILWVTKPAEPGPARNNVLKWRTGAVCVGECRIPMAESDAEQAIGMPSWGGPMKKLGFDGPLVPRTPPVASGRYPSNLLVTARALGDDSKYGNLEAWAQARGLSDEWLDVALSAGVLRVAKPARSEKNAGCEDRNGHATVKPLTLMAFLCTLACPRGGTVLDPFLGSGTTAVAAVQSGMHYIGIEREPEYVTIAEARIAAALRNKQPTLALEAAE